MKILCRSIPWILAQTVTPETTQTRPLWPATPGWHRSAMKRLLGQAGWGFRDITIIISIIVVVVLVVMAIIMYNCDYHHYYDVTASHLEYVPSKHHVARPR